MTDVATPSPADRPDPVIGEYLAIWAESITQVLSQIAGSPVTIKASDVAPAEVPPASDGDIQVTIFAAGSVRGEMAVRIPLPVALALGQLFLSESPDATAEFKPDHGEAVQELLRQIAGQVASALKPRWGEVQLRVEASPAPSWPADAGGWLSSAEGAPSRLYLEWKISAALHAALATVPDPAKAPPDPAAGDFATTPLATQPPLRADNLGLLMDVELEVVLRFGERNMRLQEILELGAGSVVELDRRIDEPADLLLDGRVIARGEVVVVDGNYGLRVLEVENTASSSQAAAG